MKRVYLVGLMAEKRLLLAVAKSIKEALGYEVRLSCMETLPVDLQNMGAILSYFLKVFYPDMLALVVLLPIRGSVFIHHVALVGTDGERVHERQYFEEVCEKVKSLVTAGFPKL